MDIVAVLQYCYLGCCTVSFLFLSVLKYMYTLCQTLNNFNILLHYYNVNEKKPKAIKDGLYFAWFLQKSLCLEWPKATIWLLLKFRIHYDIFKALHVLSHVHFRTFHPVIEQPLASSVKIYGLYPAVQLLTCCFPYYHLRVWWQF